MFTLYTVPLSCIISAFSCIQHHLYADDTQIYLCVTSQNASSAIPKLQKCLQDIQSWMSLSKLKLNPDKTQLIIFGSEAQRKQLSHLFPTNILGNDLTPVNKVCYLGVIFDAAFSFTDQVNNIWKLCFCQIRNCRHVRKCLLSPWQMHWLAVVLTTVIPLCVA